MLPPYPPTLDNQDCATARRRFQEQARIVAHQYYDRMRAKAIWRRWLALFSGRSNTLCRLADLPTTMLFGARRLPDLQQVSIDRIVGSDNRSGDFDRGFASLHPHDRERWVSLAAIWFEGRSLPPVELVQVGNDYYVVDGHHRISVAHAFGQTTIEAMVLLAGSPTPAADLELVLAECQPC